MTKNEQFIAFIESLRTDENTNMLNTVLDGYNTCMEAGVLSKIGKAALPYAAAAGMLGTGVASGALNDSDLMKYQQEEQNKINYSTNDISNIIKEHESAIKSGDSDAKEKAYSALKAANIKVIYDKNTNFKFYHDDNLGRDFSVNGDEITGDERKYLPSS